MCDSLLIKETKGESAYCQLCERIKDTEYVIEDGLFRICIEHIGAYISALEMMKKGRDNSKNDIYDLMEIVYENPPENCIHCGEEINKNHKTLNVKISAYSSMHTQCIDNHIKCLRNEMNSKDIMVYLL